MTSHRLAHALRHIGALALAAPLAACLVENPAFMLDTEGARTGTGTAATIDPGTGTVTTDTGVADTGMTGMTGDAGTGPGPTSTTSTSLPADTTTDESTSAGSSSTGVNACTELAVVDIRAVDDAFFVSGSTDNGTRCEYYDNVPGVESPCHKLNFGALSSMRLARIDDGIDAMYAVRFSPQELTVLLEPGIQVLEAELFMTAYDKSDDLVDLEVGLISQTWVEGDKAGTLAGPADSSFDFASPGVPWNGGDGPRGASTKAAVMLVPEPTEDFYTLTSGPIDLGLDFFEQLGAKGLSVYIPKNLPIGSRTSGLIALEAPQDQSKHPFLRVHYCT